MSSRDELEARIREHMSRVEAMLSGTAEERAEILDNVEAHIRMSLQARGGEGQATVQELEAVLAEMDPPSSYGEGVVAEPGVGSERRSSPLVWVLASLGVLAAGIVVLNIVYQALGTGAEASLADRPVVVSSVPVAGDQAVDPGLGEIRVTFDRPMLTDRMWSWCIESSDTWPVMDVDGVRYVDEQTCVAPVRLEPNKTYVIWVNNEEHDAFRDRRHRPVVPFRLSFRTGG